MQVEVKLFAHLRERAGRETLRLEVAPPATGRTLFAAIEAGCPELAPYLRSVRLAVNLDFVPLDAPIEPGDELALIPPVSGG